ncbi:MAG: hypothetical protein ACODAU_09075 [Myxococcota bacterium]
MNRLLVLLVAPLLLLLVAGCSVFDEALRPPEGEDGGDGSDVCGRRWPARPVSVPEGDGGTGEVVLYALKNVTLDMSSSRANRTGYDLDGFCTESEEGPGECVAPSSGEYIVDGVEGIDNAFARDFYGFVDIALQTAANENESIAEIYCPGDEDCIPFQDVARQFQDEGKGTLLVLVEDWNGESSDDRMRVTIAQAAAGTPCEHRDDVEFVDGELVLISTGDPAPAPQWDGNDCWWLRSDTFVNENPEQEPRIRDTTAYVNEGETVIRLPDGRDILFFAGPAGARVNLTGAVATGTFVDGGESLEDVIVAGRWSTSELTDTGQHVGVCPGTVQQDVLTMELNKVADVLSTRPDEILPDTECDALSMGVVFEEGVRGTLVTDESGLPELGPSPPLPIPCEDQGTTDGGMTDGGM